MLRRPGLLGLLCAALISVATLEYAGPLGIAERLEHSVVVQAEDERLLRAFTTRDGYWRLPVDSARVDPEFIQRLLAYEDGRFYWHPGIDPLALVRACVQLLRHGKVVSGASTLTMQTVRLLDPGPRTLTRKLREMWRALRLEWHRDKKAILDLYLSLAPYGGNIQGLRAASLIYFGKEPARLTPAESALLIALPQRPEGRRPDRHPEAAGQARSHVLARLQAQGMVTAEQAALARRQALPERRPLSFLAPHLAERLKRQSPAKTMHTSSIDWGLQSRLQRLGRHRQLRLEAGETLALLVVRNRDRRVLAHLGSGDYFGTTHAGALDLTRRLRSPGSTLKPFIYGLGFELGLIHPQTRIQDRPYQLGGYRPVNFDGRYRGGISVQEALRKSLNVPAVKVLRRIGPARLAQRLKRCGIGLAFPRDTGPGLPLALGGVGMKLEDLVALYAALADGGRFGPLNYATDTQVSQQQPLLSEAAAWQVSRILEQTDAPAGTLRAGPRLSYKTGTSYGFRDAWAIGYDREYTVGVWVGRPDGGYGAGRTGLDRAAPILFDVFRLLPGPVVNRPVKVPEGVLDLPHEDLPPALQWLEPGRAAPGVNQSLEVLRIGFPLDGAVISLSRKEGGIAPIVLRAKGGTPPYLWMVNGEPIRGPISLARLAWVPDGPGQNRISLVDARGAIKSLNVWLENERL